MVLSRNFVMMTVVGYVLKYLQKATLLDSSQEIIKEAASLLGRLHRKDEVQREHNLHDKMLLICTRFLEQPTDLAGYDNVNAHLIQ